MRWVVDDDLSFGVGDEPLVLELRQQMVAFAGRHLQDSVLAEDVAHEALLCAFGGAASFSGRSTAKTWVFAILKNKIADCRRENYRQAGGARKARELAADEGVSAFFDDQGHWLPDECPANWGNPVAVLRDKQFRQILERCLSDLPPPQAKAFLLREFFELETEDICNALGVSVSNLYVLLHRARLRLRASLEAQWRLGE